MFITGREPEVIYRNDNERKAQFKLAYLYDLAMWSIKLTQRMTYRGVTRVEGNELRQTKPVANAAS